jgi:predicted alpha/beta-hydrolase family hydrolase
VIDGTSAPTPELLSDGPEDAATTVILAHGAGEPMDSSLLETFAGGLARSGRRVIRFEFPYMAERRRSGRRRPPDPLPQLIAAYRNVTTRIDHGTKLVLGGRSMGGRVASLIADELRVAALLLIAYPFHPPRRPAVTRTEHLACMRTPTLILQGERDPFGTPADVAGYRLAPPIRVAWIPDGDHALAPRRRSGRTAADNLELAVSTADRFLDSVS